MFVKHLMILLIMLGGLAGAFVTIGLIGYGTMESLGKFPSNAPRIFLKMIIILFLVIIFSISLLAVALLLYAKK